MVANSNIIYVSKNTLYPRFGVAYPQRGVAFVRNDLPGPAMKFVADHEQYHLKDKSRWWVWREIKANACGAWKHPLGFVVCVIMSLAPYRLKYYWQRMKQGK